eukprot:1138334-Pelagomonas_calceolata.AAC.1
MEQVASSLLAQWQAVGVHRLTAKSPERATPRPHTQQGHPQKNTDEYFVCTLHRKPIKLGIPGNEFCLTSMPSFRADGQGCPGRARAAGVNPTGKQANPGAHAPWMGLRRKKVAR